MTSDISASPALRRSQPVEISTGWAGRLLDVLTALAWGALLGTAVAGGLNALLGLAVEQGALVVTDPAAADDAIIAALAAIPAAYVVANLCSLLRTVHYARHVGDARRRDGYEHTPVPIYQQAVAVGDTRVGRAFAGWTVLAVIALCGAGLLVVLGLVTLIGAEGGSADLATGGLALGGALLVGAAGVLLLWGVRRLRVWRTDRLGAQSFRSAVRRDPDAPVVPERVPGLYRIVALACTIGGWTARAAAIVGAGLFGLWATGSGDAVPGGGRVVVLPDTLSDPPAGETAALLALSNVGTVVLLAALLVSVLVTALGAVKHTQAVRALLGRPEVGAGAGSTGTNVDPTLSREALSLRSGTRRLTSLVGAVAAAVTVVALSTLGFVAPGADPAVLLAVTGAVVVATVLADLLTEPVSRRHRNTIWATWPAATPAGRAT